jgi:chromosome segregation ATPase
MMRKDFLFAIALLLAGCAGVRIPSLPYGEPEERQVIHLIDYAQRFATMTAEQQRNEYNASNHAFARDKDAISRMRLALLLATPGASIHDAARAASLLEPLATPSDAASPLRSLARLFHAQLNERASEHKRANQIREQIEARKEAERSLREQLEARKEAERTLREQLEARKEAERSLREQLEARKEAERTLREQLEALKEVERTIMQRGQESQPRRR